MGSIGVYCQHVDESQALESAGLVVSTLSAGQYKTELASNQPLSPEARGALQKNIDAFYKQFTGNVARGRGVPLSKVTGGFGQGRCLTASDALNAGMIDGVMTMDQVIARMRSKQIGQFGTSRHPGASKAALALALSRPPKATRNQLRQLLLKA
ncbi:putative signal peptide peptidase SppA [mine drainage metagenome]|uniref:Putative signal peptide peptidase SppA n=1 Tax=mine drainage metagenome TaxID=410659 RepID=A0A1J5P3M4_9ZZZZ